MTIIKGEGKMESIFASKLYKASTRKDRIHAALIAPSNLGLVQQLADSLDEEYQTPKNLGVDEFNKTEKAAEGFNEFLIDEDIDPSKDLVTMDDIGTKSGGSKSSHSSRPSHLGPKPTFDDDDGPSDEGPSGDKPDIDTSDLMPDSPATDESEPEPAEASTKVHAATVVELTSLKSTLNSREDTAGVTRIAEKENEVWIYYNDDTNLNNVMTEVIECLMNSGYESFEFNRLARSDNAIVFVTLLETAEEPESIEDVK